jgi:uncharacterized protein
MIKQLSFILLLFTFSFAEAQIEKELPARPAPARLVVDYTNTLAPDQKEALENKLVSFDDSTSTQIAIVIIESTGIYEISDYAVALGRAWGIGNKETNNGILLLVAKNDRKMWIATGYGLEGALPDATAKDIIESEIKPNFKENDFYRGLDQGTDAIIAATKGEYTAPEHYRNRNKDGEGIPAIVIIIIVFIIISIIKRGGGGGHYNRRGYRNSGSSALWWLAAGSGFGGGHSSGGSSSGGFGGFGGGSFGGGGSGGSW